MSAEITTIGVLTSSALAGVVGTGVLAQVTPFDSAIIERLGAAGFIVLAFGLMLKWFMAQFERKDKEVLTIHERNLDVLAALTKEVSSLYVTNTQKVEAIKELTLEIREMRRERPHTV
jgi:hypothetical protein